MTDKDAAPARTGGHHGVELARRQLDPLAVDADLAAEDANPPASESARAGAAYRIAALGFGVQCGCVVKEGMSERGRLDLAPDRKGEGDSRHPLRTHDPSPTTRPATAEPYRLETTAHPSS
jgi:hypothetical protein